MGETWIGIDASIILTVMILVVGIYVRILQEKVGNLEDELNELRNDFYNKRG